MNTAIHDPPKQLSIITGSLAGPIQCELAPEVQLRISGTIQSAGIAVIDVESPGQLAVATDHRGTLQRLRIELDQDRKETKRPFNDALAKIEETYQKELAAISAEEKRIIGLSNTYARKLQDEQDAQREQAQRDEAARVKEAADLHERAEAAGNAGDKDRAAMLLLDAEKLSTGQPDGPATKPAVRVQAKLDYDIAGASEREKLRNTLTFASRFPHLCDIAPKRAVVLSMLNNNGFADCGEKDGMPDVPGLRVFEKLTSRIRTPR